MKEIAGDNDINARRLYRTVGPDWLMDKADPAYTDALLAKIRAYLKSGDKILDICCGYGRLAIPLLEDGYDVTGIDISDVLIFKGINLFQEYGISRRSLLVANMKKLPFREATFDFCFCVWASFNFLLNETEQLMALEEIKRVLKRGGRAFIECPIHRDHEDNQLIHVDNASYLYCPITANEMQTLIGQSFFTEWNVEIKKIVNRERLLVLLKK